MVRAPCCEKMGLKKGSWTLEEDQILVSYIQIYGHGNWRALPKQAGLLRCGKSCRLRWINYLKPDIKRGNFTKDEEEAIIKLHETLGNRWSAIAARLPGRTDNEIKNVWHTHLKKRVHPTRTVQDPNKKTRAESKPVAIQPKPSTSHKGCDDTGTVFVSPALSCSEISSSSAADESNGLGIREEYMDSWQEYPEIDESFWSEELSMDVSSTLVDDFTAMGAPSNASFNDPFESFSQINTVDMNFWLRVFMEAGDLQQLPDNI